MIEGVECKFSSCDSVAARSVPRYEYDDVDHIQKVTAGWAPSVKDAKSMDKASTLPSGTSML